MVSTLRSALILAAIGISLPSGGGTLVAQVPSPPVRIVQSIDEGQLVTLPGNTHPLAKRAFDRGPVAPDLQMGDLVLVLRRSPEAQAAFNAYVASEYEPGSPKYHSWLAPEEVGEEFGAASSDVEVICNWLSGRGFTIEEVSPDRLSIRFSGTAAQVEGAFHTEMHNLVTHRPGPASGVAESQNHIANMSDPQIPAALAPVVVGVKALHNFFPRPLHRLGSQVLLDLTSGSRQRIGLPPVVPSKVPGIDAPTGIFPQFGTVDGYGNTIEDVTPYDFATIYDVLPLWRASTAIDGTGQAIAIAGTSNIKLSDVAAFRAAFGLPAKVPSIVITNSDPGDCPSFNSSCAGDLIENTLDVEWSGAVAKGANISLVTSSAPTPTTDALYLSESYIVQHKTAPVMNVSYGECELALGNAGSTLYNNLWQTAASEGIAVFVASGDAGSPACDQGYDAVDGVPYGAQFGLEISGIASTAYDTAVGGTDFNWGTTASPYWSSTNTSGTGASALGYIPEVPWNSSCTNPLILPQLEADAAYIGVAGVINAEAACNFVLESGPYIDSNYGVNLAGLVDTIGGGGGTSNCTSSNGGSPYSCSGGWPKPSWQSGVPGILNDGHRDIPDVSFFASNGFLGSFYLICVSAGGSACSYSATSEPVAQEVGGTSVASPAMAGVMALINQKSASSQGNPNQLLYTLASEQSWSNCSSETVKASSSCIFNDINTGTNAMACVSGSPYCTTMYSGDPLGVLSSYQASMGYDAATGLGSLNVANVVNYWPTSTTSPVVKLSATTLTFAATTVGLAAATQTVTLKNAGKSALNLNGTGQGITIAGTNAGSFSQTNTCGTSVAAGAACTITVTFRPARAAALSAHVNIADNAYGSPQLVALSGTGIAVAPVAQLSANSLTFGSTVVGSTNVAPAITLTNSGTVVLDISSIGITGSNAASYSQTHTCGATLAVGASCNITITFKPQAAGTVAASLGVADNAAGSPQAVALSGTGAVTVTLTPSSLTFSATTVGTTSAAQLVTVKNTSAGVVTLGLTSFSGTNPNSFLKSATTCSSTLAAGASCTISVEFKPAGTGARTAILKLADNATGSPQQVTLSGTGQ
jgi:subtilase family serine protease